MTAPVGPLGPVRPWSGGADAQRHSAHPPARASDTRGLDSAARAGAALSELDAVMLRALMNAPGASGDVQRDLLLAGGRAELLLGREANAAELATVLLRGNPRDVEAWRLLVTSLAIHWPTLGLAGAARGLSWFPADPMLRTWWGLLALTTGRATEGRLMLARVTSDAGTPFSATLAALEGESPRFDETLADLIRLEATARYGPANLSRDPVPAALQASILATMHPAREPGFRLPLPPVAADGGGGVTNAQAWIGGWLGGIRQSLQMNERAGLVPLVMGLVVLAALRVKGPEWLAVGMGVALGVLFWTRWRSRQE
ncbi:MAG: hypothetical protein ABJD11_10335 [Gemmatimonadota bacterium]